MSIFNEVEMPITITCKVCQTKHYVGNLENQLKGIKEILCDGCGRVLVPKWKSWK